MAALSLRGSLNDDTGWCGRKGQQFCRDASAAAIAPHTVLMGIADRCKHD
jgi:hypothetical protein